MDWGELKYWVGLSQIENIGPRRFKKILARFKPLSDFFWADRGALIEAGLEPWLVDKIAAARAAVDINQAVADLASEKIKVVTYLDSDYPLILKEIYDFPPLLYYRGSLDWINNLTLAIVGTRKPTVYGEEITNFIVSDLVASGLVIVSGLALGIDSIAHEATLTSGGQTVAVLGGGLDRRSLYPHSNIKLAEKIVAAGGAVISEFPCGMPPHKQNFPLRNRLISGLSLGTLVIEAGEDSGALITAKCALDQNREVFAIPGNIHQFTSLGPNNLIKQGAKVVTSANDILETLNLTLIKEHVTMREMSADTPEEARILSGLSFEPVHIDQLISASGLSSQQVNSLVAMMEIKGKIRDVGGRRYVINKLKRRGDL